MNKNASKIFFLLLKVVLVLITIMLVVSIIFHCCTSSVINCSRRAREKATVVSLTLALEQYKNDMGQYPTTNDSRLVMQELTGFKDSDDTIDILYTTNSLWNGPYYIAKKLKFKSRMMNEALLDPWKSPYSFDFSANKPKIWSWGRNRKNEYGTGDDIGNSNWY